MTSDIGIFDDTMNRFLLFIFGLLFALTSYGQHPSFYMVGGEELAGIDIYSILQDNDGNMWFTTESGLMRYDGYQFHEYSTEEMELKSLFGLTLDNTGTPFCHSVNGQIYHVKNDSLKLYYELPDAYKWIYMFMEFDDRNNLMISCGDYFSLSHDKKLTRLLSWKYPRNFSLKRSDAGEILLADLTNDKILAWRNGQLSDFANIPEDYQDLFGNIQIGTDGSSFYGMTAIEPKLFNLKRGEISKVELKNALNAEGTANICIDRNSRIWMAYETNGLQIFERDGRSVFKDELLFPNYRISAFCQDREGNIWLPTFGRGIIVIPKLDVVDIGKNEGFDDFSLVSICKDGTDNIFIGTQRGNLFKIGSESIESNEVLPRLLKKYNRPLKGMCYLKEQDVIYSGEDFLDPETGEKKDEFLISKMEPVSFSNYGWLIPLNTGVLFQSRRNAAETQEILKRFNFRKLGDQGVIRLGRTYKIHWDPALENIWASTTLGLKIVSKDGISEATLEGNPIYASNFYDDGELLWIGARNAGVLVYKGETLVRQMTEQDGLLSDNILEVKFEDGWMYFSSSKGIQRYNVRKKELQTLTVSQGLNSNNIVDFEITKEHIWVITSSGLQKLSKSVFYNKDVTPILQWDSAVANDSIELTEEYFQLTYDQNKLYFEFHANAFRHRGTLKYEYKLSGVQNSWEALDFSQNSIVFNSLSPGTYTFTVRAKNENGLVSNYLKKTFVITPPFWETWLFYLLCAVFTVLLFVLLFRLRLSIVKKRLIIERELKVSEIKAIKAQMNPHFVFNALNSLQDLVMMEDVRSTNSYLSKFAELMRGTLELSGKQFITLEKELEMLELYLQLEKLRFGEEFQYSFQLNLSKSNSEYLIPTMLLQPYVENAVKHGLLHKEEDKRLTVSFQDSPNGFSCEITDNGVGRSKSAEISERRSSKHQSFAQEANSSRIDLINQTLNHKIDHQIIDLIENGKAVGTKVIFHFSYQMPLNK